MCYEKRDAEQARACFERDQRKGDYISRKALLEEYDRVHVGPAGGARKLIEDTPAADVVPVVHGRWLDNEDYTFCSVCGVQWNYCDNETQDFNHCPNCGARMDGE